VDVKSTWKRLGKLDKVFIFGLLLYIALFILIPASGFVTFLQFVLIAIGSWIVLRLTRVALRKAIWRLRNRLIVAYVLIAVVPILLILILAGLGAYMLAGQVAVYLVRSEMERRVASLQSVAEVVIHVQPAARAEIMRRTTELYPRLVLLIDDHGSVSSWPENTGIAPIHAQGNQSGIAQRQEHYYCFAHVVWQGSEVTAAIPLTRRYLSEMLPGLGDVFFLLSTTAVNSRGITAGGQKFEVLPAGREVSSTRVPPPVNLFDVDLRSPSLVRAVDWLNPEKNDPAVLTVHTRISAVLGIILSQKLDEIQSLLPGLWVVVAIMFLLVELVSLVIGVSLSRTITGAVHSLYEGTQRVMRSDFTHRITVSGRDQLADLSTSFNTMTANLERLLAVAKEKERLQAEIEIAREVQEQLYPKSAPVLKTMQVLGCCHPARMVSGDYYDYQALAGNRLAIAIGDVAGKGISAALLMASIQSAMRMELRASVELGAARLSTARMVSDLNRQLHATTSPEKFATFLFALYDEDAAMLTYTNAGHLPPILVRSGTSTMLDVNGMVVGAFPSSKYDESTVQLESGDLLVFYTDGITEPENEYGEMFGEDRLIELVAKNAEHDDARIIETVMEAVHQWSGAGEQPDDMTLLLARRR
jgi:sigma-B regulation protein RsbU (phosphoserine phosphatase)